ncbi:MAG: hypothetical protein ACOCVU_00465 [Desulfohalobiaceae bacterium]
MNARIQDRHHRHKDSDQRTSGSGRPLHESVRFRVFSGSSACASLLHGLQAPQPCPPEKDTVCNETDLPPEIYLG